MTNEEFSRAIVTNYLSPREVERTYGIKVQTQEAWRHHNRYGWRDLTIKVGRNVRYKREDIDAWLESRKGIL